MNKNIIGIVALVIAVVALGITYFAPTTTQVREVIKELGATPGKEVTDNDFSIGGVRTWNYSKKFASGAATTTACSFRTPVNSTTTLVRAVGQINTATDTALVFEWGKENNSNAGTTTSLGLGVAGAGGTVTITASTSLALIDNPVDDTLIFAPGAYINLKWGGAALGPALAGVCKAQFMEL